METDVACAIMDATKKIITYTYFLGFYAPLTMDGNIIVGGILSSCHASSDNMLADIGMAPIRWFPQVVEWIFGDDNGFSAYVNIELQLGELVLPFGYLHETSNV